MPKWNSSSAATAVATSKVAELDKPEPGARYDHKGGRKCVRASKVSTRASRVSNILCQRRHDQPGSPVLAWWLWVRGTRLRKHFDRPLDTPESIVA